MSLGISQPPLALEAKTCGKFLGSALHIQDGGKKAICQNTHESMQGNADMRKEEG